MSEYWAHAAAAALARRTRGAAVTMESGYGPSGAPHLGTVAEVLRTTLVARAYRELTGSPVRLLSVTDDMDGLRRVPATVGPGTPMDDCIGMPLCEIADPGGSGSYAEANAALLRAYLAHFGLQAVPPRQSLEKLLAHAPVEPDEVLCLMASDLYRGGHYDAALTRVAQATPRILDIVLPELRAERRRTWCPFVPFHDGRAIMDTFDWALDGPDMSWTDREGRRQTASILGGSCKLQWRVDWCSRWAALGIDFEMHGKDLMDSARLGARIAPLLGGRAPQTMQYELFLDEEGAKFSKSVGNGVGMESWIRHVPPGAFWHFVGRDPRSARRIGVQTVPLVVDAWLDALRAADGRDGDAALRLVHGSTPPVPSSRLGYASTLGIAALADADDAETVWRLLEDYDPKGISRSDPVAASMVECALQRHLDVDRPARTYVVPDSEADGRALADLACCLRSCPPGATAEEVQFQVYEAGKRWGGQEGLRNFFRLAYGLLLGQDHGPRLGTLAEAVGTDCLADRIEARLRSAEGTVGQP